jgi:hypothetical protein
MSEPSLTYAADAVEARLRAESIKRRWRDGEPADTAAVLSEHPELLVFKSVVIDLAYEEYCLREEGEGAPEVDTFCEALPAYRGSIRKVIEAHRMLVEHPEMLAPEPTWPEPDTTFDGLQILAEMGRGTFARAYLAYDPQTDRACVLKLSPGRCGEGRALGPLNHPHITDVYWADRTGGMAAVCMPLLGVTTLEDVRDAAFPPAGRLPASAVGLLGAIQPAIGGADPPPPITHPDETYPTAVVAVAARIANALTYLHHHGRDHGDLKPSNVVLAPGGHPFLIDFNLSADDAAPVGGTVPYMAPERLEHLATQGGAPPAAGGDKADVYSLGVVLYELLTGRLPWRPNPLLGSVGAAADLLARRRAGVAWPEAAAVPGPIARLVEACLADDPDARPAAAGVEAVLVRWLSAQRGEPAGPARRPNRAALVLCVGAVAAALGIAMSRSSPGPGPTAADPHPGPGAPVPAPVTPQDRFRRGLDLVGRKEYPSALIEFQFAQPGDTAGSLAYQAYCLARMGMAPNAQADRQGHLNAAFNLGNRARAAGADRAAVNNNLGVAHLELGRLDDALTALNRAVEQDALLHAARYNRAHARFLKLVQNPDVLDVADRRFHDRNAADDILHALTRPPESVEFYREAAKVLALSVHLDESLRGRAVHCLAEAVRLGGDPKRLAKEPILSRNLDADPGYAAALAGTPDEPRVERSVKDRGEFRLVEPVRP